MQQRSDLSRSGRVRLIYVQFLVPACRDCFPAVAVPSIPIRTTSMTCACYREWREGHSFFMPNESPCCTPQTTAQPGTHVGPGKISSDIMSRKKPKGSSQWLARLNVAWIRHCRPRYCSHQPSLVVPEAEDPLSGCTKMAISLDLTCRLVVNTRQPCQQLEPQILAVSSLPVSA